MGIAAFNLAQPDRAEACLRESASLDRVIGDRWGLMYASTYLGLTLIVKGNYEEAERLIIDAIEHMLVLGRRVIIPESFEGLVAVAAAKGENERAVLFAGAAEAIRDVVGSMASPTLQSIRDGYLTRARSQLEAATFESLYDRGKAMPLDRIIELALSGGAPV